MAISRGLSPALAIAAGAVMAAAFWAARGQPDRPPSSQPSKARVHGYEIAAEHPHDIDASTQGLVYRGGFLYESTGLAGSSLRKVRLDTGEIVQQRRVERGFGEGLTAWGRRLVQLTPMRTVPTVRSTFRRVHDLPFILTAIGRRLGGNSGDVYDLASFERVATFTYSGEGWGLARDERRLILSDGTSHLRFLDPERFHEVGRVQVTDDGRPIDRLNELEVVKGGIYANVWLENRIAIIHPDSGRVTAWIDMTGLASRMKTPPDPAAGDVLNGIAYDAAGDRLFVTGKRWPRVFEIRVRPRD
jgi:glutamine cyclotransferase